LPVTANGVAKICPTCGFSQNQTITIHRPYTVITEYKTEENGLGPELKLNDFMHDVHSNAKAKGWWREDRSFGEIIALCHAELSEALEEYRNGCAMDTKYYTKEGKPEGIAVELADTIIRILDFCGHAGIDIEAALKEKHEYNKLRPYRHGGKVM
jgi:NTP pyrophosphatase (non-canonical NTP hydrolase)